MLKIIGVIITIVSYNFSLNGMIIHSNAASMPFGAFLIDVLVLLWCIFQFCHILLNGFKNGLKFKEVVKENYF